jgi:hypothetical protein
MLDRFEFAVTRPFQERRQFFRRQRCEQCPRFTRLGAVN